MNITPVEAKWIEENIKSIDFLSFLKPPELNQVIENVSPRILTGSQAVLKEGQMGNLFFLIYNGKVSVSIQRQGKQSKLAVLQKGDFFGEISLMTGKPATADVMALAPTKVFFLDNNQFLSLVRPNKDVVNFLIKTMKKRLTERKDAIEALKYGNIAEINQAIKDFLSK